MATLEELSAALVKADAAGNAADAQAFADAIRQMRGGIPAPRKTGTAADLIPGNTYAVPASTAAPARGPASLREKLLAPVETAVALTTGAITAPIVAGSEVLGALTSGKYGTKEGVRAGEAQARQVQQFFQPALSPTAQGYTEAIGNALASTGLQGVPLNVLGDLSRGVSAGTRAAAPMVKAPIQARQQRIQTERVRESEMNAPRIDAAKDAFDLKLSLNPALSNPNAANRMRVAAVGSTALDSNLSKLNLPKIAVLAKEDMGLPETTKLNAKAFDTALEAPTISVPYDKVRAIPRVTANAAVLDDLDNLRVAPTIGDMGQANAVNTFLDAAKQQLQAGADGKIIVDSIRQRRRDAQAIYNQQSAGINPPSPEAIARADASMGIANALEKAVENSITDPRLLTEFQNARSLAARIYDYRRATNLATGVVDPQALAKLAAEGKPLSGNAAKIANVAANFPENLQGGVVREPSFREKLTRSSAGGTAGALIGSVGGLPGAIVGGGVGAALGNIGAGVAARSMAKPGFQKSAAMPPDYRPIPSGLTPAEINYGPNQVVPFNPAQAVVSPGQVPYQPNFAMQGQGQGPSRVVYDPVAKTFRGEFGEPPPSPVTSAAPPTRNMLPAPSAEGTLNMLETERARAGQMSRTLGQQAEQRGDVTYYRTKSGQTTTTPPNEPADMYTRVFRGTGGPEGRDIFELQPKGSYIPPKRGEGVAYTLDERGNLVPDIKAPAAQQLPVMSSLESAVQKLSGQVIEQPSTTYKTITVSPKTGAQPYTRIIKQEGETTFERGVPRAFDLTATEKIAWNKAKADLAEVAPGFKALTDKAIANKMMDRAWIQDTITKAREKAAMFDDISKRVAGEQAKRDAAIKRDQMLDVLATLEERLSAPRPTSSGIQGPKTRAAIRNQLVGGEKKNNLAP